MRYVIGVMALSVATSSMGIDQMDTANCEVRHMKVRNIRWVGIPTTNYEAMLVFLRDTMGLRVNFQESTTAEFSAWEGDAIQIIAPGDPYFEFFTTEASGPVPLFEVDDVHKARAELEAADVEIVGRRLAIVAGTGSTSVRRMATSTCESSPRLTNLAHRSSAHECARHAAEGRTFTRSDAPSSRHVRCS
jgi:hypothetical protein